MVGKYDHVYIYIYIYIYIYRERERERERNREMEMGLGIWEASMDAYMPCQTHDIIFLSIETHSYFPLKST